MDARTFEAALGQFRKVRARDFQGAQCKAWSREEAREHRAAEAKAKAERDAADMRKATQRRQRGVQDAGGAGGFYAALTQELGAKGVPNVAEVVKEVKTIYEAKLYENNLDELEAIVGGL